MERMLDIEVTRRCNLRCDYCFVGWSRDWHAQLPYEVAESIVREGAGRFDVLHLTGGEPFSYRGLLDLVDLALELGYASVLINTNGTLLGSEAIARLARHNGRARLSMSFDGPRDVHDPVRGEGRFDEADAALERALAAGVPVTVMTVVTRTVLATLPTFLLERRRRHPSLAGITLFPVGVGPTGSQKPGAPLTDLSPDQLTELASVVALARRAGVPVMVGAYPMINPLLKALGYPESELYQCTAGRGRICVHADLTVSPCHPVREAVYGRWQPGLFERLEEFAAHGRLARRDFDGCSTCSKREACGHCRAFVTASGADFYGNDRVCHDVVPGRREEAQRADADAPVTRRVALPVLQ
ncbi:MAG: radical SAM protein [Polyangiaceae bacterium]